ncbi:MAG: hypothetical protein FWE82_10380 [Defluviitaleaceae bacterium]|nr:hypothetical protein [Defluviitaleaceae bacterium]
MSIFQPSPPDHGAFARPAELLEKFLAGERGSSIMHKAGFKNKVRAFEKFKDEKDPYIKGGLITKYVLENAPVFIEPPDVFAAGALVPEITAEDDAAERAYHSHNESQASNLGHCVMDYHAVIKNGVDGLFKRIDSADKPGAENLYASMKLSLEGVLAYAAKYRAEALRQLEGTDISEERAVELKRIANALENVPLNGARSLFEAVQSLLICHYAVLISHINSNMLGRVDLILDEFYSHDIKNGLVSQAEAAEWMQFIYIKSSELVGLGDAITMGGCRADGSPFYNDLTYFLLDAVKAQHHHQPQMIFRFADGMPEQLLERAFAPLLAGVPQPGFFNDNVTVASLIKAGFSAEDARDYVVCACAELTSAGKSNILSGYLYHNLAKPIEILLNGGEKMVDDSHWRAWPSHVFPSEIPLDFKSFDDFSSAYVKYLKFLLKLLAENSNEYLSRKADIRYTLTSALTRDCIENGLSLAEGGARYNHTFPNFVGLVTASDSLAAIKKCVYEDRLLSLEELAKICKNNFEGREDIRLYLLNKCPKYGNDDADADEMAKLVYDTVAETLPEFTNHLGVPYAPCYFGEMQYGPHAKNIAATPDGRRFGEAITPTLGGDCGRDASGITALINSVTCYDHTLTPGGLAANFAVSPFSFKDENDFPHMVTLLKAYFSKGGMQAQFNRISKETLLDAKKNPDKHRGLLVRVAGFSGYFVDQQPVIQDQIIERVMH